MPPLIAFAGALGGLAVVRWAYRTAVRVNRELEEARLARVAEAATVEAIFRRCGGIPTPAPIARADSHGRLISADERGLRPISAHGPRAVRSG